MAALWKALTLPARPDPGDGQPRLLLWQYKFPARHYPRQGRHLLAKPAYRFTGTKPAATGEASSSLSQIYTDRIAAALQVVTPQLVSNNLMVNTIQSAGASNINVLLGQNNNFVIAATGTPQSGQITFDASGNGRFSGQLESSSLVVISGTTSVFSVLPGIVTIGSSSTPASLQISGAAIIGSGFASSTAPANGLLVQGFCRYWHYHAGRRCPSRARAGLASLTSPPPAALPYSMSPPMAMLASAPAARRPLYI